MFDPDNDENDIGKEIARAEAFEQYQLSYLDMSEEKRPSFEQYLEDIKFKQNER